MYRVNVGFAIVSLYVFSRVAICSSCVCVISVKMYPEYEIKMMMMMMMMMMMGNCYFGVRHQGEITKWFNVAMFLQYSEFPDRI